MSDDNWVTVLKADDGSEIQHNSATGYFSVTGHDWSLHCAAAKEILRLQSERRLAVDVLREILASCQIGILARAMIDQLIEDLSR